MSKNRVSRLLLVLFLLVACFVALTPSTSPAREPAAQSVAQTQHAAIKVALTVDPAKVIGHVDEKLYGQFLEHIYHSVNGGLWGDVVWDRSFEEILGRGDWSVVQGALQTPADVGKEPLFLFGDANWRDYEFSVEVLRTSSSGEVIVGMRGDRDDGYELAMGAGDDRRIELRTLSNDRKARKREVTVEQAVDGTIETGKWRRVRVRCQGRQVQAWVDDHSIIDCIAKGGPPQGLAFVAARGADARFRNIRVTSPDGKDLYAGLPAPPRHWRVVGDCQVSLDVDRPLNSAVSLKVAAASAGQGIAQDHFRVHKDDALRGSLWLRGEAGEAPGGLVVRLTDRQKTLAEAALPAPSSDWREFPLLLDPAEDAPDATLQILSAGKAAFRVDQVSLMPDSARATGGYRPDLLAAISGLHPSVVRWPGGSFVGSYDWKASIGPQSKRAGKKGWDELDPISFGIDEFVPFCRKVGAEPLVVVFTGPRNQPDARPRYVQDACDFVEYCNGPATSKWGAARAANGHPEPYGVKYWEIDNEIWSMKADDYVGVVKAFVPAMKHVDPAIHTIACGSGQLGARWGEGDLAVIDQCADLVDYLSVHHYESPDRFADGPADAEKFWTSLGQRIAKSKNPNLKLYVSEWNAMCLDWRGGLYAGGILNTLERNETVGMACPALWLRHVSAPGWDIAFINFDSCRWFPAPNYVVMKLWRDHFAPDRVALDGDAGPLNVIATRSGDSSGNRPVIIKAVNPGSVPVEVELKAAGFAADTASLTLVDPGDLSARNTLDDPGNVHPHAGMVTLEGSTVRFTLPPISAGVLTIEHRGK